MSINCTDRKALEAFMADNLKPKRYIHSLGVEKMAVRLASLHGADTEKAAFAGRYHDIAKCFSEKVMDDYIIRYGLPHEYIGNNALAHSKVAAAILERDFGVDDRDILDAVSSHTTGRDGMSLLEEIIYTADAIEENRQYDEIEALRELAYTDLDAACLYIMDYTIDKITSSGRTLDKDTTEARRFIAARIASRKGCEAAPDEIVINI